MSQDIAFWPSCISDAITSAGSIYQSIAILTKVRYRYLVVSRYFDIFGIERPLFDTFDTFNNFDNLSFILKNIAVNWEVQL